ncbi:MAG: hypothetical protein ABI169_08150 [Chitinophagaceae bacterium]
MLLLSIGSCQPKDSQNTEPHIPISDQRLIDAATAKVGSYFVYQDSATGVTDSFYVTDYSLPYYEYQPTEQKWLQVTGYTAFNGISTYPGPRIGLGTSENKIGVSCTLNTLVGSGFGMEIPFIANSSLTGRGSGSYALNYFSTYKVLGVTYINVYESISRDRQWNTSVWQHNWFSESSGLVKFSLYDTSLRYTYYLIRSKIIK